MSDLKIQNLSVWAEDKQILDGVSVTLSPGKISVLLGPNGSGKSTLGLALAGSPNYRVTGKALLGSKNLLKLKPDERARAGLFLAYQQPLAVSGVPITQFLRLAYNNTHPKKTMSVLEFRDYLQTEAGKVGLKAGLLSRSLNEGFSGGEKKRTEMLQLSALKPKFAILDEIDSGLDADGIKKVAASVNLLVKEGLGVLVITHYSRLLDFLKPDNVHVLHNGRIVDAGGKGLVQKIDKKGYAVYES